MSLQVVVLYGGKSTEHEVSVHSAQTVCRLLAAQPEKYQIFPVFIDKKGHWFLQETCGPKTAHDKAITPVLQEDVTLKSLDGTWCLKADVFFPVLHGSNGEDGTMQGLLDVIGLPYTGPGVWSSATAIDKAKSKIFYERGGVPTPPSDTLVAGSAPEDVIAFANQHGWPVVVKPATEGSALGVFVVSDETEVRDAFEEAFDIDNEVLVERYIAGTEITVAVLGNEKLQALPIVQIIPRNSFYDFEAKYAPGGSQHLCPAPLVRATSEP